jgi:hypothetical protein
MPAWLSLCAKHEKLDVCVTLRDRAVDMVGEGVALAVRIDALGDYPDFVAPLRRTDIGNLCSAGISCVPRHANEPCRFVPA